MLKKFRWPAILALGATTTFLTPGTVQARDYYEREHHRHRHHHHVVVTSDTGRAATTIEEATGTLMVIMTAGAIGIPTVKPSDVCRVCHKENWLQLVPDCAKR